MNGKFDLNQKPTEKPRKRSKSGRMRSARRIENKDEVQNTIHL